MTKPKDYPSPKQIIKHCEYIARLNEQSYRENLADGELQPAQENLIRANILRQIVMNIRANHCWVNK